MHWFGFGFNAFGQICVQEKLVKEEISDTVGEVKVSIPTELNVDGRGCCCSKCSQIRASWSRRASLHLDGEFGSSVSFKGAIKCYTQ